MQQLRAITVILASTLVFGGQVACRQAGQWPQVRPLTKVVDVPDGRSAHVELDLIGSDDRVLYRLECHNWTYEKDRDFAYSGDFECRLEPIYQITPYSTLLTDNPQQSRDWESRGRFLIRELTGTCADYAEYGRIRTFALRGMQLRLELSNLKFSEDVASTIPGAAGLTSFRVTINVRQDPKAQSEIAEPSTAPWPLSECGLGYRSGR